MIYFGNLNFKVLRWICLSHSKNKAHSFTCLAASLDLKDCLRNVVIDSVWIINPYLKVVRTWCRGGDSRTDIIRVSSVHPLLAPLSASDWSVHSLFCPLIGCRSPHLSSPCASVSSYQVSMTTQSSPLPSPCPAPIGWGASITASYWTMLTTKSCVTFPTNFLTLTSARKSEFTCTHITSVFLSVFFVCLWKLHFTFRRYLTQDDVF